MIIRASITFIQQLTDYFPDMIEHLTGQTPGLGILAAGVIGTDQEFSTWESMNAGMGKDMIPFGRKNMRRTASNAIRPNATKTFGSMISISCSMYG